MYNHIEYSRMIAINLATIAHSEKKPRFFISAGLSSLDGIVSNISTANLPCIVAEDNCDERITDNLSDNPIGVPFYSLYVLFPASPGNDIETVEARHKARIEAKKIISRIYSDYLNSNHGLNLLDPNSIRMQGVGPLGDYAHGVMVTFTLQQAANIVFNPDEWLDNGSN